MSLPPEIIIAVPTGALIVLDVALMLCAITLAAGVLTDILWMRKAKEEEPGSILTSNSDISQEETKRVRAVKIS
jgi:hypothetical protein